MNNNCWNIVVSISRRVSTCTPLHKNRQIIRTRIESKIKTDKLTKAIDIKAAKNRSLWEKSVKERNKNSGKFCTDDVYFMNDYERKRYSLSDAIRNHQEFLLDSTMLDSPSAILTANFILNFRTKKETKFIQKIDGIVNLPHQLDFLPKRNILAFCMSPEEAEIAMTCGAFQAGDISLVKKLEQGTIFYEQFDQVVCQTDALGLVSKLRPVLKDKLPSKLTPHRIGPNIEELVKKYVNGYEFETTKIDGVPEEAQLSLPLGRISWPVEYLEANFRSFLTEIVKNASSQITGDLVSELTLVCLPSDERIPVDINTEVAATLKERPTKHGRKTRAVDSEENST